MQIPWPAGNNQVYESLFINALIKHKINFKNEDKGGSSLCNIFQSLQTKTVSNVSGTEKCAIPKLKS